MRTVAAIAISKLDSVLIILSMQLDGDMCTSPSTEYWIAICEEIFSAIYRRIAEPYIFFLHVSAGGPRAEEISIQAQDGNPGENFMGHEVFIERRHVSCVPIKHILGTDGHVSHA